MSKNREEHTYLINGNGYDTKQGYMDYETKLLISSLLITILSCLPYPFLVAGMSRCEIRFGKNKLGMIIQL